MTTIPTTRTRAEQLAASRDMSATGRGREIRIRARLSQDDVAQDCDVSGAAVSRWETGQAMPRGEAALRWLDLMERLDRAYPEAA
jgi:DNA-binding transcriptional regulator YiaG